MTAQEAADALGVDRSRLLKLIRENRLKATKHGNAYWIERKEVERFAALPRSVGRPKGKRKEEQEEG